MRGPGLLSPGTDGMQFLRESGRFVCRPVICGSSRAGSILGAKAFEFETRTGGASSNHYTHGSKFPPHVFRLPVRRSRASAAFGVGLNECPTGLCRATQGASARLPSVRGDGAV